MRKKLVVVIAVAVMLLSLTTLFAGCKELTTEGKDYTIPLIDLESKPEGLDAK